MTPYQRKRLEEERRYWRSVTYSTARVNRATAEDAIRRIRRVERPNDGDVQFVWSESPLECLKKVLAYTRDLGMSVGRTFQIPYLGFAQFESPVLDKIGEIVFGTPDPGVTADGFRKATHVGQHLGLKYLRDKNLFQDSGNRVSSRAFFEANLEVIGDVVRETSFFINFDHYVFCSERPTAVEVDDRGRLHCTKGPTLAWGDEERHFHIHGIAVPEKYITKPRSLNPPIINAEKNAEVRRVLMELYGVDKYLRITGAQVIHEGKYGRLWWRGPEHETPEESRVWQILRRVPEPLVMVEVVNSTPESDGSFKRYFLRVSPHIRDADEAVASTFRLKKEDYHPDVET